jgi:hypothetical protein
MAFCGECWRIFHTLEGKSFGSYKKEVQNAKHVKREKHLFISAQLVLLRDFLT